jgi:predicted flap endonuclease-1-like 5' DNA nuclease
MPGLNLQDQTLLLNCGIETTQQLLHATRTPLQRQALANQMQTHLQRVNKWVALADLARIPAVGCRYCGLLLHAGISSPAQLAQTPLPRLHRQILKLQVAMMQRQDLCPSLDQMAEWIAQAKQITRKDEL